MRPGKRWALCKNGSIYNFTHIKNLTPDILNFDIDQKQLSTIKDLGRVKS